jgi:hypothetical protein
MHEKGILSCDNRDLNIRSCGCVYQDPEFGEESLGCREADLPLSQALGYQLEGVYPRYITTNRRYK